MAEYDDLVPAEGVMPLGHLLLRAERRAPDAEALVFPDVRWTYRELTDRAWAVARSLVALGVRPGEHVGLLMTNHPDLVASFFGASLAGAVVVPINARYRASELEFLVEDADLVALLTHDSADEHVDFTALLAEALATRPPLLRHVVMLGARRPEGMVDRERFLAAGADDAQAEAELVRRVEGQRMRDPALILYTSGTTSTPRGAILTQEAHVRTWLTTGATWGTTASDRHYTALPLFHVTALGCLTWVLAAGATFITDYHWDAGRALEAVQRERATEFYPAYQPIMEDFVNHPNFATADLSAIRTFLNVAPPEVLAKFQALIPHAVQLTTYGGTEGGPVTLARPDDALEDRLSTCGRPQPGLELRVCDQDTGEPVPPGTIGILQFRGFNTLSGYHKSPEKTAETMLEGGWVTMQDLGVVDERGYALFLGRAKETLKVGGENVAPQEVEAQLCTHPAVKLAQVVGMPDERLIEVPAAFVELVPGAQVDAQELIDHVRGRVARFKVPRLIRFIDGADWPMSTTKIQRTALRARLLEELTQKGATP